MSTFYWRDGDREPRFGFGWGLYTSLHMHGKNGKDHTMYGECTWVRGTFGSGSLHAILTSVHLRKHELHAETQPVSGLVQRHH